ncbi:hypothetical protein V8F06_012633 [Rhypophila decipiens]
MGSRHLEGPLLGLDDVTTEELISFELDPLIKPAPNSNHILVLGGGVTGLVTSWVLPDQGYNVTIMSKQWASYTKNQRIAFQIAGALWEFPPAVCDQHQDPISLHHSKRWAMIAYKVWETIAADLKFSRASGVRMKKSAFFFSKKLEQDDEQYRKMLDIQSAEVPPVIGTDQAVTWLMELTRSKGAKFVTGTIEGDIFDSEISLRWRFGADVIVNATGLVGLDLAQDKSCYPIRGGVIRVINDGSQFEKVNAAFCISAAARQNEFVFILPRSDRILLLGGISQPHGWNLDLTLESPEIQRMKGRCEDFLPRLKDARLDEEYPLAQGLRPFRGRNVRVERELRMQKVSSCDGDANGHGHVNDGAFVASRIVHSYGHGGSGWSSSFGCARDVLKLVQEALAGNTPRQMSME